MDEADHTGSQALVEAPVHFHDVGTAEIAYRRIGAGPPLLLVHGWPFSGMSWRKLVPLLAGHRTCYVVDLPGTGETRWRDDNDFRFHGQALNLARLLEGLGIDRCDVVAHDTGATIARELALLAPERVGRMVLLNTEIPGHRPPWIQMFQLTAALPGAGAVFRWLLGSRAFVHSSMGFGNCFVDRALLDGDFRTHFIDGVIRSPRRIDGLLRYLRGIDWELVDGLARRHREIRAPVLFVWGADDPTFPMALAEEMSSQLAECRGFRRVLGAKLLVHEERPAEVAAHVIEFLEGSTP